MNPDRRQFITLSGATAGAMLAGCLGDGDDEREGHDDSEADDDTTSERSLGIEHVRFIDGEPSGRREYTEVEDATYGDDEVVWIYYEPVGLATEALGDGEERIDLRPQLEITDPSGDVAQTFEEEFDQTIAEGQADEQFLWWSYQPSTEAEAGTYTAELTLIDEIAGEQATATTTFTLEGPGFSEMFSEAIDEELRIQVESLEVTDDTVELVYNSQFGITTGEASYEIGFIGGIFARDVDRGWDVDELVATFTDEQGDQYRFGLGADLGRQWMEGEIDEDEFTFGLLDTVEARGGASSVAARTPLFRSWIQANTDIQLESLGVTGGVVELTYQSDHSIETDAGINELGDIGTVFALLVDDSWPAERLDGLLTDGEGEAFTFGIDRETALDWTESRISDEEFGERIRDSVESA